MKLEIVTAETTTQHLLSGSGNQRSWQVARRNAFANRGRMALTGYLFAKVA
jgi:uncharacterized membrane protein YeiB